MRIARQFQFDAGHRVLGHEGKCRHLHGHRYVAEVVVEAPQLDDLGRVIDFGVMKTLVGKWIDENWDHNMLLHPDDPILKITAVQLRANRQGDGWDIHQGSVAIKELVGRTPFVMPAGNPTAENIALVLFGVAAQLLGPHKLEVVLVKVWETPNCWAEADRPIGSASPESKDEVLNGEQTIAFLEKCVEGDVVISSQPANNIPNLVRRAGLEDRGLCVSVQNHHLGTQLRIIVRREARLR